MTFKENLADFKKKIDREIVVYLDRVIRESKKKDAFMTGALQYVKKMMQAGGKRIRPALMYYGYVGAGGKEKEKMLRTAVSIELIHFFLLIHDDIIDNDEKRHGIDTVNFKYRKVGKRFFSRSDFKHFGDSMGIMVGDMVGALGNQIIFESGFNPNLIMKALSKIQTIVSLTVIGEAKDVYLEYRKNATEKEVLSVYEYKTAKYTIEGPLHLGAILGGADKKIMEGISRYAIPLGIAFQIQDDILGIFGDEKKLGKGVGADIKEGKETLLVVKARENGSRKQKEILNGILGKKDLTFEEIKNFRNIITETEALGYAKNYASDLIAEGKKELSKLNFRKEANDFLQGMADYMISREM